MLTIRLTRHAVERWREHVDEHTSRGKIKGAVAKHLLPALEAGVMCDRVTGAVHMGIQKDLIAVIRPSIWGGWEVITFYVPYEMQQEQEATQ